MDKVGQVYGIDIYEAQDNEGAALIMCSNHDDGVQIKQAKAVIGTKEGEKTYILEFRGERMILTDRGNGMLDVQTYPDGQPGFTLLRIPADRTKSLAKLMQAAAGFINIKYNLKNIPIGVQAAPGIPSFLMQ